MVKDKIDHQEKIIEDLKRKQQNKQEFQPWKDRADMVNNTLRPLLKTINKDLLNLVLENAASLPKADLEKALDLEEKEAQASS